MKNVFDFKSFLEELLGHEINDVKILTEADMQAIAKEKEYEREMSDEEKLFKLCNEFNDKLTEICEFVDELNNDNREYDIKLIVFALNSFFEASGFLTAYEQLKLNGYTSCIDGHEAIN